MVVAVDDVPTVIVAPEVSDKPIFISPVVCAFPISISPNITLEPIFNAVVPAIVSFTASNVVVLILPVVACMSPVDVIFPTVEIAPVSAKDAPDKVPADVIVPVPVVEMLPLVVMTPDDEILAALNEPPIVVVLPETPILIPEQEA